MATGGCAMLTTLLESRSRRVRDNRGTAASVTLHAAIIFAAVYATATGTIPKDNPINPPSIHWITPALPFTPRTPARADNMLRTSSTVPMTRAQIAVDVPTSIPSIEIPLSPVTSELSRNANSSAHAAPPIGDTGDIGRRAYDASEVET